MKLEQTNFENAETATYHGANVEDSEQDMEQKLGSPSIVYDDGQKSRTEWDLSDDAGHFIKVFDHHHYGHLNPEQWIQWSIEANDGPTDVHRGPTGEFLSSLEPTPTEQAVIDLIRNR